MQRFLRLLCLVGISMRPAVGRAEEITVAVAANFIGAFAVIRAKFEQETNHRVVTVAGSTGKLYAQVENGAPFDLFLAADRETPARVVAAGLGESPFNYANGALVLWSKRPGYVDAAGQVLARGTFAHLALANPELAPYGRAARQVLWNLGLFDKLKARIVLGESIAQTQQFVETENAELGFVALSQILDPQQPKGGSYWLVPQQLYACLDQDGIVLAPGQGKPAVAEFTRRLGSTGTCAIIRRYGYRCPRGAP